MTAFSSSVNVTPYLSLCNSEANDTLWNVIIFSSHLFSIMMYRVQTTVLVPNSLHFFVYFAFSWKTIVFLPETSYLLFWHLGENETVPGTKRFYLFERQRYKKEKKKVLFDFFRPTSDLSYLSWFWEIVSSTRGSWLLKSSILNKNRDLAYFQICQERTCKISGNKCSCLTEGKYQSSEFISILFQAIYLPVLERFYTSKLSGICLISSFIK